MVALRQRFLKLKSALAGKADVEDDASSLFGIVCVDKLLHGGMCLGAESYRLKQSLQSFADTVIVVDDDNRGAPVLLIINQPLSPRSWTA